MFTNLAAKLALKKAGFSVPKMPSYPETKNEDGTTSPYVPANPFANISYPKSWNSWATPPPPPIEPKEVPQIGTRAPTNNKLRLPPPDGRPTAVLFLRYCGCPFAEKNFLQIRALANKHPQVSFIAVSHSSPSSTERWVRDLGGAWSVTIVVDEARELYALWGLDISNSWYLLNPWTQAAIYKLGKEENIWNREPGEGACRWQIGGAWAMDWRGVVRWGGKSVRVEGESGKGGLEAGVQVLLGLS